MKRRPLVYVRWDDAAHPTTGEWLHQDGLDTEVDVPVETAGFLVHRDKHIVMVAVSLACRGAEDNEQYTGVMTIPMGCVVSIQELDPKTGKKIYAKRSKKSPRTGEAGG